MMHSYNSLSDWLSNTENFCPSVGDVNLLVITVHIPGATANTKKVKNDIEKVFFSEGDD